MSVGPWAQAAARLAWSQVPEATIFWAHDLRALPAAIAARDHAGGGSIVYDVHEIFPEAGEHALRPAWARAQMAALERHLAGNARAVVTVNDALAERLADALAIQPVVTARNCPPRWRRPEDARDASPLRSATGLGPNVPIVLYHGGLAPGRGIEILGAAIELPGLEAVHLVFMGQGPSRQQAVALANASSRVHVLDPVPPSELLSWVAGADVAVAPIQPTTLNHRLSSPNKVFEALAAGVPVVGSDIPGIREVIGADPSAPLGVLVDPDDPADVAAAIRSILDRPLAEREALRRRCIAAAHDRWNWETESAGIVALARDLAAGMDHQVAKPAVEGLPIPQSICFVLPSTGAFDARTARFASDLADRGHSVTVVARSGPGLPSEESPRPRLRIIRVDSGPSSGPAPTSRWRFGGPFLEAMRIARVIRRVRRQRRAVARLNLRPDIVHAMGFLALPVATDLVGRTGARLVYDARDLYVESNNIARLPRILRSVFAWREGRWARRAATVFTVNTVCAEYLQRRYGIERPIVVMNGQRPWQIPDPRPNLIRDRLGLQPVSKVALYHGGF
ncbi:MAG: glycosyltransferase, partial [Chloroflexota bacterium]